MAKEILHHMGPDRRVPIVLAFVVLITLVEICGQTTLKMAQVKKNQFLLIVGLGLYLVVAYTLYRCYEYEGMGHTNLVWSSMSIILASLVGYAWFKEPFNKYNWIAIAFALLAVYFAHRGDEGD